MNFATFSPDTVVNDPVEISVPEPASGLLLVIGVMATCSADREEPYALSDP